MISLVIKKEILDNLLNARFIAASVVSVLLILTSVVVLTHSYVGRLDEYRANVSSEDEFIDRFGHLNRISWMSIPIRMPSRFQALVLGINKEGLEGNFTSNPVPSLLPHLDFITIVTVIMSLMAVLFSYNGLCGERETGMLRLIAATGGSRSGLVVGKFIGGNISLLVPFTIGVLAGFLYLTLSSGLGMSGSDFGVIMLLMLASWLLISSFYGLGLLISARAHTSSEAVLSALSAWTVFVLLIPNVSPFLAARLYPSPSVAKMEKDVRWIESDERDQIIGQRGREMLQGAFADVAVVAHMTPNDRQAAIQADPKLSERYAVYAKAWEEMARQVNAEQREKGGKLRSAADERAKSQERFATLFASLSPISGYIFAATGLTETGIEGDSRWTRLQGQYSNDLSKFTQSRFERAREQNPAFDFNDYLDLRDRPRFDYRPAPVSERIDLTLPQFGLLAFFNVLFLAGALMSFLRYDVR